MVGDPVRTFSADAILPEYAYVGDNAVSISEHSCRQCYLVVGHKVRIVNVGRGGRGGALLCG